MDDNTAVETAKQVPGVIPLEIRNIIAGYFKNGPYEKEKAALAYFAAHCKAVGIDEPFQVCGNWIETDQDGNKEDREEFVDVTYEQAIGMVPLELPFRLSDATIEFPVKINEDGPDAFDINGHKKTRMAWIDIKLHCFIRKDADDMKKRNPDKKERGVDAIIKQNLREIEEHASFLCSVGVMATAHQAHDHKMAAEIDLYGILPLTVPVHDEDLSFEFCDIAKIGDGVKGDFSTFRDPYFCINASIFGDMLWKVYCQNDRTLPECIARSPEDVMALLEEWRDAGYDREIFNATGARRLAASPETIEPIVPGLIYRGKVHLLLGATKVGKSTSEHELAFKLSAKRPSGSEPLTWWGQTLARGDKPLIVHFLSGEDTQDIIAQRDKALRGAGIGEPNIVVLYANHATLKRYLARLKTAKRGDPGVPDLLIIDPARVFLDGNEDSSDNVNQFFLDLTACADQTGMAVLVSHHLGKGAQPRSLSEVMLCSRGSGVWLERPRVILGMYRVGGVTRAGACQGNIPGLKVNEAIVLMRDEASGQHIPKPSATARTADKPSPAIASGNEDAVERVLDALRGLIDSGKRVTASGKKDGLHVYAPAELEGVSRDTIRHCLDTLMQDGRVVRAEDGSLTIADVLDGQPMAAE